MQEAPGVVEAKVGSDAGPANARKGSNSKTNIFLTSNCSEGQGILPQGGAPASRGTVAGSQGKFTFPNVPATLVAVAL